MSIWQNLNQQTTSDQLSITAPSVDETDIDWWGTASIDDATDPVTATITLAGITRFGPQLTITAPGSGYTSGPDISIASSNGNGQPCKGTGTITGGELTGWTQTTQGYDLVAPLVVTISGGSGSGATATATLGRQFATNDYVIWNDVTISGNSYAYEIDQITSITPIGDTSFTATLARAGPQASSGQAQYGSILTGHSDAALFRLINEQFEKTVDFSGGPQVLKLPWDSMTVAAVELTGAGLATPALVNLAPAPYLPDGVTVNSRLFPPSPGLRTMNGAAYTSLGAFGALYAGQTAVARVPVQAWESVRYVYGSVRIAPTGPTTFNGDENACIVVYVCYILKDISQAALVDTLVIDTGDLVSYPSSNPPDGRQMPRHFYWGHIAPNLDWPPSILPELTGALNASGNLQLGFSVSTSTGIVMAPDGYLDFIIGQVGTTLPGSALTVSVQT